MTRLQKFLPLAMKTKKQTQGEIAAVIGCHRTHLLAIVAGKSIPSLELAFRLAAVLGKSVPALWELTEVGIRARPAQN